MHRRLSGSWAGGSSTREAHGRGWVSLSALASKLRRSHAACCGPPCRCLCRSRDALSMSRSLSRQGRRGGARAACAGGMHGGPCSTAQLACIPRVAASSTRRLATPALSHLGRPVPTPRLCFRLDLQAHRRDDDIAIVNAGMRFRMAQAAGAPQCLCTPVPVHPSAYALQCLPCCRQPSTHRAPSRTRASLQAAVHAVFCSACSTPPVHIQR